MTAEKESEGSEQLRAELNDGLRPDAAIVAAMCEARDVVRQPAALEDLSAEMQRRRWLAENQEAFKSTNEEFERHGLRLEDLMVESDYSWPRSAEDQEWLDVPPVGKELL